MVKYTSVRVCVCECVCVCVSQQHDRVTRWLRKKKERFVYVKLKESINMYEKVIG